MHQKPTQPALPSPEEVHDTSMVEQSTDIVQSQDASETPDVENGLDPLENVPESEIDIAPPEDENPVENPPMIIRQ